MLALVSSKVEENVKWN